ncbi:Arc family DNA-binding protein [Acinetobacter variabilis]|uniref:Arc family DNA-binding protein n=1 Tax=Acinetobacter variabilis TaxID=70346 RepID=UPI0035D3EC1A
MSEESNIVTLKVRVTPEFRERIVETAKTNNRSMNQEIVARLEESFDNKDIGQEFFQKNLHLFLSAYCAGLESNYDEAISQIEESLSQTKNPEMIQFLEHRLQINKILKKEMNRLMKNNSEKFKAELSKEVSQEQLAHTHLAKDKPLTPTQDEDLW